jgi:hypothetical protein
MSYWGADMGTARKMRPIGPRMAKALEFIKTHPGVCKAEVFRGTGVRRSRDGSDPVDRLLRRRLIYARASGRWTAPSGPC